MARRLVVPLLLASALTLGPVAIVGAREPPTTGDRWTPIDPATLPERVTVAPETPFPSGTFRVQDFAIQTLAWERLPYNGMSLMSLRDPINGDADGIGYKVVKGRNYYSPGNIADQGIRFVDSYVRTGDPRYLKRAKIRAAKLREIGFVRDGALWIPYRFNWPTEHLKAPWVSAYSQGFALSLFVRLYRVTGESTYLEGAQAVFRSFRQLGPGSRPWVSYVVRGQLWLEEYPSSRPSHVLNAFAFAVFGLYDYERLTRDPAAHQLLEGALSTLRRTAGSFRVPGEVSLYDLVHRTRHAHYHDVVVWQLRDLGAMSRDPYFRALANVLEADHG